MISEVCTGVMIKISICLDYLTLKMDALCSYKMSVTILVS
jgi:hypothetical protein